MVSVRMFATTDRVVSLRLRKLVSVDYMRADLATGAGARTAPGILGRMAEYLAMRMEPVIEDIEDRLGVLEGRSVTEATPTYDAIFTKFGAKPSRFGGIWPRSATR